MTQSSSNNAEEMIANQALDFLLDLKETDHSDPNLLVWLRQSPLHVREFLRASAVLQALKALPPYDDKGLRALIDQAKAASPQDNVISLSGTEAPAPRAAEVKRPLSAGKRWTWGVVGALAAGLYAVLVIVPGPNDSTEYRTALGEQRSFVLSDGSVVELNTNSRVRIELGKHKREVLISQGEALFNVAHDATRPFQVTANRNRILALGTQFDVFKDGVQTRISVVEGSVQVSSSGSLRTSRQGEVVDTTGRSDNDPVERMQNHGRLHAGEQASVYSDGAIYRHTQPDISTAVAWRDRKIVFKDWPLRRIAAEVNRYSTKPVEVEGAAADLRLTGTISVDDFDALLLFIQTRKDTSVRETRGGYVIESVPLKANSVNQ